MRRRWPAALVLMLLAVPAHASRQHDLTDDAFPGDGGDGARYLLLAVLGVICLLGALLVRHLRRAAALLHATPVPLSLLVVERLARAVQRRHGVLAAIGVAAVPAVLAMDLGPLAIIATIVASVGLRGFFIARTVLHLIEAGGPGVSAEALAHIVTVRASGLEERLEVAPGALAAALRHAVPTSVARR